MYALVFRVSDAWVSASWVNQVILHHEGRRNPEDGGVRDGGGQTNEKMKAKGVDRATKHGAKYTEGCRMPLRTLMFGQPITPMTRIKKPIL